VIELQVIPHITRMFPYNFRAIIAFGFSPINSCFKMTPDPRSLSRIFPLEKTGYYYVQD
jgi:hypothetical protein